MDAEHWRNAYQEALAAGDVLKAENERLRAENERLRSHAATIKHLMDGPVQIPTTTIWAELCKMTDCK